MTVTAQRLKNVWAEKGASLAALVRAGWVERGTVDLTPAGHAKLAELEAETVRAETERRMKIERLTVTVNAADLEDVLTHFANSFSYATSDRVLIPVLRRLAERFVAVAGSGSWPSRGGSLEGHLALAPRGVRSRGRRRSARDADARRPS